MKQSHIVRSPQDLGALIAQARHQRGLSQRQLAADFGVTQAWISRVEQGYPKSWIGQVLRLAVYLGIELQVVDKNPAELPATDSPGSTAYPDIDNLVS